MMSRVRDFFHDEEEISNKYEEDLHQFEKEYHQYLSQLSDDDLIDQLEMHDISEFSDEEPIEEDEIDNDPIDEDE